MLYTLFLTTEWVSKCVFLSDGLCFLLCDLIWSPVLYFVIKLLFKVLEGCSLSACRIPSHSDKSDSNSWVESTGIAGYFYTKKLNSIRTVGTSTFLFLVVFQYGVAVAGLLGQVWKASSVVTKCPTVGYRCPHSSMTGRFVFLPWNNEISALVITKESSLCGAFHIPIRTYSVLNLIYSNYKQAFSMRGGGREKPSNIYFTCVDVCVQTFLHTSVVKLSYLSTMQI